MLNVGIHKYSSHNDLLISSTVAVDGNWGRWSGFGKCSKSCGGGYEQRTRSCNDPSPSNGGASCKKMSHEERPCNVQACTGS